MLAVRGRLYRLELTTIGAEATDASWLPGPLAAAYPEADLASLRPGGPSTPVIAVLRWRGGSVEIRQGDRIDGVVPGLPGFADRSAYAVVGRVDDIGEWAHGGHKMVSHALVIAASIGIIGGVAYLSGRIKPERRA